MTQSTIASEAPVDARSLLILFDSIFLLAMTAWLGSILFFSFGVAPILFKILDPASAARFVRALFPRYYVWGAYSGMIALGSLVCGRLTHPEYRGWTVGVLSVAILIGVSVSMYCLVSLTPAINAARDAGADQKARFDRLHKRSVVLNSVNLLIGVGLLVAFAARPAPRSSGIVEMTQKERIERDAEVLRRRSAEFESALRKAAATP